MSYYGRTYESQYLCGMAAGAISKVVNWALSQQIPLDLLIGPLMLLHGGT